MEAQVTHHQRWAPIMMVSQSCCHWSMPFLSMDAILILATIADAALQSVCTNGCMRTAV